MRNRQFFLTHLMKLLLQILLYCSLFYSFFRILSLTNPQMLNLSRTAATTIATFGVTLFILTLVYGGFDIGEKKSRSVFSSVLIVIFFSDIITYVQLQIMNVNPANNPTLILWGEDLFLLMAVMLLQVVLTYVFVSLGYYLYFKINPPQRCCIITSSQEMADHVAKKIASFRQKFKLCEVIHYECPDVKETIRRHDTIFLAGIPDTEESQLKNYCYRRHKIMYLLAELDDVIISTSEQNVLDDTPFLYIRPAEPTLFQYLIKRFMDVSISFLGLIVTSPIIVVAAICNFLLEGRPIFFRQKRATLHGKVFEIIKFRTMYMEDSAEGAEVVSAQENDARVTPFGAFLRKYRIDELPQLYNVLRGDMSIVGPRPEMLENLERYEMEVPEFKYRQQMKAGITGLAQIDGKYNTTPKDKAILDLLYIENFSTVMDLKLILRTITVFFRRDSTEGFSSRKSVNCPVMRTEALPVTEDKPASTPEPKKPGSKATAT